jgi:mono/diheme cytochrome c family protein
MRGTLAAALTASLALSGCEVRDRDLPAIYRELEVPRDRLASPDVQRQGRAIFRLHCAACHGEAVDGRGVRAAELTPPPPDLADVEWQARTDERRVYYAIAEGGHGRPMPPWKASLSPGEIWSLVAYIRSLSPRPVGADSAPPPGVERSGAAREDRR